MGNCVKKTTASTREDEADERSVRFSSHASKGLRAKGKCHEVKIVLSRGELDWLLLQLKENGQGSLEKVMGEIEKGRRKRERRSRGWKPSLESIRESPEVRPPSPEVSI